MNVNYPATKDHWVSSSMFDNNKYVWGFTMLLENEISVDSFAGGASNGYHRAAKRYINLCQDKEPQQLAA